jgi:hypothetical protein
MMEDEAAQKAKTKRLATTYLDGVREVIVHPEIESKVRNGITEYQRRVWVRTSGGSVLIVLTSDASEVLRFHEQETAA